LSKLNAEKVARHLVAAGRLVDDDPAAALEHARAARALGARVAVVREAVGETAYAAGEWTEAIAELRTARRMTGDDSALPMIADAERALGRADRALTIARSDEARALDPAARAEMIIVEAGARHDLGQLDAALLTLQDFGLDRTAPQPWSARVWYAYADLLLTAGREEEARDWFAAAAGADQDGSTDAEDRLLQLDGIEVLTDEDEDTAQTDPGTTDLTATDPTDDPEVATGTDTPHSTAPHTPDVPDGLRAVPAGGEAKAHGGGSADEAEPGQPAEAGPANTADEAGLANAADEAGPANAADEAGPANAADEAGPANAADEAEVARTAEPAAGEKPAADPTVLTFSDQSESGSSE
jgi:hypothetical protein